MLLKTSDAEGSDFSHDFELFLLVAEMTRGLNKVVGVTSDVESEFIDRTGAISGSATR